MSRTYLYFALRRIGQAIIVIFLAYVFTFVVISVLPGDPVTAMLSNPENNFSDDEVAQLVQYYGLDQPVLVQLAGQISRFVQGDLGISVQSGTPVSTMVAGAIPSTLKLAGCALIVAIVVALLIAAPTQFIAWKPLQSAVRSMPSFLLSVPNFVIGLVLIQIFAFQLGLFSIIEPDGFTATLFAAIMLGLPVSAQIAEVLITNLDHEKRQEYYFVARSRGLRFDRVFFRHLLRPSSLPVVTVVAVTVGNLLGGSLITEAVFGRRGLGTVIQTAVSNQDIPVIQAIVALAAIVFVTVNLIADLVYPLLDPQLRINRDATSRKKVSV